MTGSAFLDLFISLTDKNTSDTAYRAFALNMFNLILKDIQNRQENFHWRFLEKTATASQVADQFFYDLPSDIDTQKVVHLSERTNDITYKFKPYNVFKKYVADPSNEDGTSRIFTILVLQLIQAHS